MKKSLVVSIIGADDTATVLDLARTVSECDCNIEEGHMSVMGQDFAWIMRVTGNWNSVAKTEAALRAMGRKESLTITTRYTETREPRENLMPYVIDAISVDRPGIAQHIVEFCVARDVHIEELSGTTYAAAHTGTPMLGLSVSISVPADLHIGRLRQEFTDFCDDLNLDATLEPARH